MADINPNLPHITFVIHDIEGGIASMNHQIIENADFTGSFNVHVVMWKMNENTAKSFFDKFSSVQDVTKFNFSKNDNYHFTLKSFNKLLNKWPGIIITNDGFELQALKRFRTTSVIFSIVHDFYNLKLAVNSLDIVDYFLCHTETYTKTLLSSSSLINRVYYLPHGVKADRRIINRPADRNKPLKIISISRLVESKGVMHLFEIDELLLKEDVRVDWTIIGSGELEQMLKSQWTEKTNITFLNPDTNSEVVEIAKTGDIFISPSTFEGYGIALLEAMSCGLVPIISKLPVGIYSSLPDSIGFSIETCDIGSFAECIKILNNNRELLTKRSADAQNFICSNYNITSTSNGYLETIKVNSLPQVAKNIFHKNMSSFGLLDQHFIPNSLTRILKKLKAQFSFKLFNKE